MKNVQFTGVFPALVTPLTAQEQLHEETARKLLRFHLRYGVDGFYLCGATGEGPVLPPQTRMALAEVAREETQGKARIIVHVGAVDLRTAVLLAEHAAKIGADAISSVPPFFFHYGEKEIAQYYTALAQASGLPLLLYCSPLSGVNITYEIASRLLEIPGATGVKWTSYDYYTMQRIKLLRGGAVNVLTGPDECLLCGLAMGADGGIGATYNVMPGVFRKLYDAFREGNLQEAQRMQLHANRLIEIIIRFGVQASVKEILARAGYDCGHCLYPMPRLTDEERRRLNDALDAIDYEGEYL